MKDNMYDGASPSGKKVGRKVSLTEGDGTYNRHPDPVLGKYPRSDNKIPLKFSGPDLMPSKSNPMESMRKGKASKPTSSRVNNSKNRYETNKKNVIGKIG